MGFFQVWFYGRDSQKPKSKKLVRIGQDKRSKAKGFSVYYKKKIKGKWQRINSEIELFPSYIKTIQDKDLFIESYIDSIKIELGIADEVMPELKLPDIPRPPRIQLTKKKFMTKTLVMLKDELKKQTKLWSKARLKKFVEKLWFGYSHAPHLIHSDLFKKNLVILELKRIKDEKLRKKTNENLQEAFRKKLQQKETSLDPVVDGKVEVKFKEVFDFKFMKDEEETTKFERENVDIVEKDRQSAFVQISTEYEKAIEVTAKDILGTRKNTDKAFEKLGNDVENLFDEAVKKGVYVPSDEAEYSIRIITPIFNKRGYIPKEYLDREGEKTTGYGFSIPRVKIKTKKDLRNVIENFVSLATKALLKYVKLNNASSFAISGFVLERKLEG